MRTYQDRDSYPGAAWEASAPAEAGLHPERLEALRGLVGGRGCVVRHGCLVFTWGDAAQPGDIASAVKPILSTLLLLAVQEGRLGSVDDPLARVEPRLRSLNGGKDAGISWHHLAHQTSGYGLTEPPGAAYAYNDYAIALFYDTLMAHVFREAGTQALRARLGEPLGWQDPYTFEAFGASDRPGRLSLSVRDLARFGLLYLRGGIWRDRPLLRPDLRTLATACPLPASTPRTDGKDAAMLPGQRTLGGGKNITPVGPGYYCFNWWLNGTDKAGRRLYVDAPPDVCVASGHGGKRALWVFPSADLVVAWNDGNVDDHDSSPGNPQSLGSRMARLLRDALH